MLSLVQFGQWDKESGRETSQESIQQSVHISGPRLSNQSWKHLEVQIELLKVAWNYFYVALNYFCVLKHRPVDK